MTGWHNLSGAHMAQELKPAKLMALGMTGNRMVRA